MDGKYYTSWRSLEDDDYLINLINSRNDENERDLWNLENTKHYKLSLEYLYNTSIFDREYSKVWYYTHNTTSFQLRTVCALWFFSLVLQITYWNLMNLNILNLNLREYINVNNYWSINYILHLFCFPLILCLREHVWIGIVIVLLLDITYINHCINLPRLNMITRIIILINICWLIHFNYFVFSLK